MPKKRRGNRRRGRNDNVDDEDTAWGAARAARNKKIATSRGADEWDAFADSDEENKKKKAAPAEKAAPAAKDDGSGGDDWENSDDSDNTPAKKKPAAEPAADDGDDGDDWEDDSDDAAPDVVFIEATTKASAAEERNKDLATAKDDFDDDSEGSSEDPFAHKGPKERENKDHIPLYGKRLREHKQKLRDERLKIKDAQKKERLKKRAAMTEEEKKEEDRYTEDNALLFGDTVTNAGWQNYEVTFPKRPLGFSIDPHKRVRKMTDKLKEDGLTRGAILIRLNGDDMTKAPKDHVIARLKACTFPLKIMFYNPPYDDALLKTEEANKLHGKKKERRGPPPGAKIDLSQYPLQCPGDFKKFGTLIGKMIHKSRFNNKGDCVLPFLKELLHLSCKNLEVDEIGQAQTAINQIWQTANRKRRGGKKKTKFAKNEEVECNYQDTGEWYNAIVMDVKKGPKYLVKYPEYDNEMEVVPEARVRERKKKMNKHQYKYEEDDFDFLGCSDSD